jgi:tRNA(adenine34) deaminase
MSGERRRLKKQVRRTDEEIMRLTLKEAEKAILEGEVPVAAIVAADGKILSRAHNQPIRRSDPTAHAEILALRKAGRRQKNYRLADCDLFVTLEPCAMCLGAAVQARVRRIIFAASDPKSGAIQSVMKFPWEKINHRPLIQGGLLETEAVKLLRSFFKTKRQRKRKHAR